MPIIRISPALRDLTGGRLKVQVAGKTVCQALDNLDAIHPGTRKRLFKRDKLDPLIAVAVDGEVSDMRTVHPLNEDSEIHFLPVVSGG